MELAAVSGMRGGGEPAMPARGDEAPPELAAAPRARSAAGRSCASGTLGCGSWWSLALLLLVGDASSLGLGLPHLPKVKPYSSCSEGVGLWLSTVLLESSSKTSDECVETAPRLPERTSTGCWRVRQAEEGAGRSMDFGLAELIQVPEELENMCSAAP